ncbi:MAG: response regulator, partial [Polyangiaceae bacterium]
ASEIAAAHGDDPSHAGALAGIEILVVDDDEDSREMVKHVLERVGASVTAVESARDAVAFVRRSPVDLLISDIGMPDEDGFSLMKKIRELPEKNASRVPGIALTAYARKEDAQQAIRVGYQRHLPKPVNVDALVGVILSLTKEKSAAVDASDHSA